MKKTFVISALLALAMTFVSCIDGMPADPNAPETPAAETVKTLTFTDKYGKVIWDIKDGWTEFTIEFAEVPSKVHFCVEGDETSSANQRWGDMYYSGEITETSKTVVFSDALDAIKAKNHGDTKVTKICLAACNDATATAKIKSVKAKKADGTTEDAGDPTFENAALE
ncbi:MAG: hypothetical protein K6A43_01795 [Treponema sp.]|nr:hypothetical protein [Treponema sp.]